MVWFAGRAKLKAPQEEGVHCISHKSGESRISSIQEYQPDNDIRYLGGYPTTTSGLFEQWIFKMGSLSQLS